MRHLLALVLCFAAVLFATAPDTELEAAIRARLAASKISSNGFQVKVRNGTAILTGRAAVMQHKGVATRLAKAAGAAKVDNRIEIPEAARAKAVERLARARQDRKLTNRSQPRSEPRSEPRTEAPQPAPVPAPPPVRKAVVKH